MIHFQYKLRGLWICLGRWISVNASSDVNDPDVAKTMSTLHEKMFLYWQTLPKTTLSLSVNITMKCLTSEIDVEISSNKTNTATKLSKEYIIDTNLCYPLTVSLLKTIVIYRQCIGFRNSTNIHTNIDTKRGLQITHSISFLTFNFNSNNI